MTVFSSDDGGAFRFRIGGRVRKISAFEIGDKNLRIEQKFQVRFFEVLLAQIRS